VRADELSGAARRPSVLRSVAYENRFENRVWALEGAASSAVGSATGFSCSRASGFMGEYF
jgi:hypothetical protein